MAGCPPLASPDRARRAVELALRCSQLGPEPGDPSSDCGGCRASVNGRGCQGRALVRLGRRMVGRHTCAQGGASPPPALGGAWRRRWCRTRPVPRRVGGRRRRRQPDVRQRPLRGGGGPRVPASCSARASDPFARSASTTAGGRLVSSTWTSTWWPAVSSWRCVFSRVCWSACCSREWGRYQLEMRRLQRHPRGLSICGVPSPRLVPTKRLPSARLWVISIMVPRLRGAARPPSDCAAVTNGSERHRNARQERLITRVITGESGVWSQVVAAFGGWMTQREACPHEWT